MSEPLPSWADPRRWMSLAERQRELVELWWDAPWLAGGFWNGATESLMAGNFLQWRHEDKCRLALQGGDWNLAAREKMAIDQFNAQRHALIENINRQLAGEIGAGINMRSYMNSETPGSIIDRMSVLALKTQRGLRDPNGRDLTAAAFEQRSDLLQALIDLMTEIHLGRRHFRLQPALKIYGATSP